MKKLSVLLFFALSLSLSASKYTPAMYEKATEPIESESSTAAQPEQAAASSDSYKNIYGDAITHRYLIVVGSFKERLNASNMVDQIKQKGEGDPFVAVSPEGMYRVAYQSSDNDAELRAVLSSIKQEYPSAWILKIGD